LNLLHKHSFVAFARILLLIFALINFQKPSQSKDHKYSNVFAKFYEKQSQTNQNPTHEQTKTQNKKTYKIQPYFSL